MKHPSAFDALVREDDTVTHLRSYISAQARASTDPVDTVYDLGGYALTYAARSREAAISGVDSSLREDACVVALDDLADALITMRRALINRGLSAAPECRLIAQAIGRINKVHFARRQQIDHTARIAILFAHHVAAFGDGAQVH